MTAIHRDNWGDQIDHTWNHQVINSQTSFTDLDADNVDSSSSGGAVSDTANVSLMNWLHERDVFPDLFWGRFETAPADVGLPLMFRWGYVNDGQTVAAAVLADQFLSEAIAVEGLDREYFEMLPLENAKVPKGGLIFLHFAVSSGNFTVLRGGMRYHERRSTE